jgi:hypothetical protein
VNAGGAWAARMGFGLPRRLGEGIATGFRFCPGRAVGDMSKRPAKAQPDNTAPTLSISERILLFCVASGTDWERAGVTGATITAMVIRDLIERDSVNRLTLTAQGGPHSTSCWRGHGHEPPRSAPGDPMTLGNMRANGVRSLDVCRPRFDHGPAGVVSAVCGQLICIKGGDEMACTEDSLFPKEQVPASRPPPPT